MKQTNFLKSFFLLCALIVGSSSVWGATNFSETYSYGGNTWTRTNFTDESTYYKSLSDKDCVASIAGIFTGKTITSDVVITLDIACYGNGSNPNSSKFSIYTSSACTTSVAATQSGTLPSSSTYTSAVYTISKENALAKFTDDLAIKVASGTKLIRFRSFRVQFSYTPAAPAYTINAQSNNNSYGTVSLSGSVITGSPNSGYRYADPAYTVTAGTATVSQEGNAFTVTPSTDCTVQINFEAIPTYKVTFNAEGGTCGTTSATETIGGEGVTLPTATTGVAGWEFIGWAADAVDNTTNQPTLYKAGSTYYPTSATVLHAVYTLSETSSTFVRVTSINQVEFAKSIVVVKNSDNFVLNHSRTAGVAAPEESAGEITAPANTIFALTGDNSDGFVLTGENGTLSQTTVSTSGSNDLATDWSGDNNQWKIEANAYATNTFALSNSTNVALEYYSGWKTEYNTSYNNRQYTAMKLYVPKSVYDSTPSALIIPTVAFGSADPVTLYLDGTTTNTNTATVEGVTKTINYSSSNTSVATVTSEGVVTAKGIGTTTITASVDAELGVSAPAYGTYKVTVKNTTTIAGLKALYNAAQSPAKAFAADLTDAVVTYVSGNHAYIQDASGAIYASCGSSLTAGKKINGAVSGTITAPYTIDEIKTIDLSAATVTEDGVIPEALTKTVAEVKANAAALDGQLVTINAVTIDKPSTTTTLRDGSKIGEEEATITMYSPNGVASVTNKEKGNFTGYISFYNGNTPRINLYEQSQFTKTHNAPQNQVMSFTKSSYNLDEETDAVTSFAGQEVTKTTVKGAVTYSIKDGSDDIITSLNSSTGAVVLNGDCGTATIVATAAYAEEEDEGIITPYPALSKEYTVTVRPRYSVTFSVNGIETVLRQSTSGATIAVPTPGDLGDYTFMGWSTSTVDPTNVEPSMTDLGANVTPEDNDDKYYAVFAKEKNVQTPGEITSTLTLNSGTVSSPYVNNGVTWTFSGLDFVSSGNGDMPNGSTVTFTLPVTATSTVSVNAPAASGWSTKNISIALTDANSTNIATFNNGISYTFTSDNNKSSAYTLTATNQDSRKAYMNTITVVYNGLVDDISYSDYRTSLTNATVTMTIGPAGFNTWHQPFAAEFIADGDNGKAYYAAGVDANQVVNFQQFSENKIPANTGAIIKGEVNAEVSYTILAADVDFSAENLLHGTNTTETITADDDYYYFISGRTKVSDDPLTYEYGFFVPKSLETGSTFTNNANKAYLQVLKTKFGGATSKGLGMSWTDAETNGITNVNSTYTDGHYYNLAGQRVSENYKGVVIYNGKKIIKK